MKTMNGFPDKVLLATDGSEDAVLAAAAAIDLTGETGAELHVVHAWQGVPSARFESFIRAQLEREAEELLAEQEKLLEAGGGKVAGAHLRKGPAVDEILDLAAELEAGLIVLGSRGMGPVKRLVMGSVSEGVVYHACCPVLVLRGGQSACPPSRVVSSDVCSDDAGKAAHLAAKIGKPFGTTALLLREYPRLPETDPEGRALNPRMVDDELRREKRALQARAAKLEEASGIRPRARISVGDAAASLIEAAEEDAPERPLIAVGTRGLGAVERLRLGSVSTKVLRASRGRCWLLTRGLTKQGSGGKGRKIAGKPDRLPVRRRSRAHSGRWVVERPREMVWVLG
jgi:nucleotide-binding universal stress UspA family protein